MSNLTFDIKHKQPARDQLERDVEEFLRNGGKKETLAPGAVSGVAEEDAEEDGP